MTPKGAQKNSDAVMGATLCKDISEVKFQSDKISIQKKERESGLGAFYRWLQEQADGWCEKGVCSTGVCRGFFKDIAVKLLAEAKDHIEVSFSVIIYCKCAKKEE